MKAIFILTAIFVSHLSAAPAEGKHYDLTARASEIDKRAKAHPEIDFLLEKDGKPQDIEHASVDTRVPPPANRRGTTSSFPTSASKPPPARTPARRWRSRSQTASWSDPISS